MISDWRTFAKDTNSSKLHTCVQNGRNIPRTINNYDPDWLLDLASEARRIDQYLRVMGLTRDIEVVFKTTPAFHGGWEWSVLGRAIRIEVFTHQKLYTYNNNIKIDSSFLRSKDQNNFVLRHEFGHAFVDNFLDITSNKWAKITHEYFADAFAIKFGSEPHITYRWRNPNTTVGKRYINGVKSISLPMDQFITAKIDEKEATNQVDARLRYIEVQAALKDLAKFAAKPKVKKEKKAAAKTIKKPDLTAVKVMDSRNE